MPTMETARTTTVTKTRGTKSTSASNPVKPERSGSLAVRSAMASMKRPPRTTTTGRRG